MLRVSMQRPSDLGIHHIGLWILDHRDVSKPVAPLHQALPLLPDSLPWKVDIHHTSRDTSGPQGFAHLIRFVAFLLSTNEDRLGFRHV